MDPVVETLATQILKEDDNKDFDLNTFLKKNVPPLQKKAKDPRHIRWAMSDAVDRAAIRRLNESMLDNFIDSLTTVIEDWE